MGVSRQKWHKLESKIKRSALTSFRNIDRDEPLSDLTHTVAGDGSQAQPGFERGGYVASVNGASTMSFVSILVDIWPLFCTLSFGHLVSNCTAHTLVLTIYLPKPQQPEKCFTTTQSKEYSKPSDFVLRKRLVWIGAERLGRGRGGYSGAMTTFWKSQSRKWCDFCKCWLSDNKPVRNHLSFAKLVDTEVSLSQRRTGGQTSRLGCSATYSSCLALLPLCADQSQGTIRTCNMQFRAANFHWC